MTSWERTLENASVGGSTLQEALLREQAAANRKLLMICVLFVLFFWGGILFMVYNPLNLSELILLAGIGGGGSVGLVFAALEARAVMRIKSQINLLKSALDQWPADDVLRLIGLMRG
jgi:hypothetical protein